MDSLDHIMTLYIAVGIIFLIIEILTTTFYGLAISLTAFVLALFVGMTGDTDFTIVQGIIGVIAASVFAYFLPKYLNSDTPDRPQGLDQYIGRKVKIKIIGDNLKVSLDGVDYLVESDEALLPKDEARVEIISIRDGVPQVRSLSEK